jgi:hypothetical protein
MVEVVLHHLGSARGVDFYHRELEWHAQEEGCNPGCTLLYAACCV